MRNEYLNFKNTFQVSLLLQKNLVNKKCQIFSIPNQNTKVFHSLQTNKAPNISLPYCVFINATLMALQFPLIFLHQLSTKLTRYGEDDVITE